MNAKPLIDIDALLSEDSNTDWKAMAMMSGQHSGANGIAEILAQLQKGNAVHYMSDGNWNHHSLLVALTEISGKAKLYVSTYAMCETATRCITMLKEQCLLSEVHCIIDNRSDVRSAESLQLLKNISTSFAMAPCHAKVSVLIGEKASVMVLGSANYTENKRIEVGIVLSDRDACNFHKDWITEQTRANGR